MLAGMGASPYLGSVESSGTGSRKSFRTPHTIITCDTPDLGQIPNQGLPASPMGAAWHGGRCGLAPARGP